MRAARHLLGLGAALGAAAVLLGAFGAHGLRTRFAGLGDGGERLGWWTTAASYHLFHAIAVCLSGFAASRTPGSRAAALSGGAFALGILLFSGSLYAMALSGVRALGAVTPVGGLSFVAGWVLLFVASRRLE